MARTASKRIAGKFVLSLGVLTLFACSSEYAPPRASLNPDSINPDSIDDQSDIKKDIIQKNPITTAQRDIKLNISDEKVLEIANKYMTTSDQENEVANAKSLYAKRLARLVKNHIKEDGLKLDYKVYLSPETNAFSLANGGIRVCSGLMDLLDDPELLAVIGHEIGHVKLGHSKSQIKKAYFSTIGMQVENSPSLQDYEKLADDYSVAFLIKHGYDKFAAISALRKISYGAAQNKSLEEIKRMSHPDTEARAKRIEKSYGALPEKSKDQKAKTKETTKAKTKVTPPKVKIVKASVKETDSSPKFWVIQVGALQDKVYAQDMLENIIDSGIKGRIDEAVVRGKRYFRVIVGPYRNKANAQEDLARITNMGFRQGDPFIRKL